MPFEWLPWRRRQPTTAHPKSSLIDSAAQSPTLRYHAATDLTDARVRAAPLPADWSAQPGLYKHYPSAPRAPLTEQIICKLPETLAVIDQLTNGPPEGEAHAAAWDLASVSRLCCYAYGPTAQQEVPGTTLTLRAVPSAGAQYPTELYLALRGASGLCSGVYHYAPDEHALETLRAVDWLSWLASTTADLPAAVAADAIFLVSSLWWRSAWKYGSRGYRYCLQDAGHVAGNLALVATALGYRATVIHHFSDVPAAQLLGLDPAVEAVQVLVAVQAATATHSPAAEPGTSPGPLTLAAEPDARPKNPAQVAAVVQAHQATVEPDRSAVLARRTCVLTATDGPPRTEPTWLVPLHHPAAGPTPGMSICQSLLERRSSHHFAPVALPSAAFATLLRTLTSVYPADVPSANQRVALDVYLIVNDVAGVPPGAYRYLAAQHSLLTIRNGNLREWATHLALDQAFCREAAALAFLMADLGPLVTRCGDRSYRMVHIEAGMRGQATYLAAHALGVGCTGIGAFFDLEVTSFFGAPEQAAVVYVLAMGQPAGY